MRMLAVTGYGKRLTVEKGMFKIESRNGDALRVNPADIEEIVIESEGVSITSAAIDLAASAGILIFFIRKSEDTVVISPIYPTKVVEARRGQYEAYRTELGMNISKSIVSSKIRNQERVLRQLSRFYRSDSIAGALSKMENIAMEASKISEEDWEDRLRKAEARAARLYWGTLALFLPDELHFEGRDPDGEDPVNFALNYSYSLLYGDCYRALAIAGLDPYAGIFHVDRAGRKSLVYDFSDPLKTFLDLNLVKSVRSGLKLQLEEGRLAKDSRKELVTSYGELRKSRVMLKARSTPESFGEAIIGLAMRLAEAFRNRFSFEGEMDMEVG